MSRIIQNDSKHMIILSNHGGYKLTAKMCVDYDSNNDIFGAREWRCEVRKIVKKKRVFFVREGEELLKRTYLRKRELIKDLQKVDMFSEAVKELNEGNKYFKSEKK